MNSAIANDCPSGQYWISPHFRSGYTKYNGVVVRPPHVSGHCRTNPRGYEKWYQKLSNNRPKLWEYKTEISKKWAAEEVERVYNALELFPQELLNLDKVELYRMIKSVSPINPATTNYKDVVLYDVAFKHEVPMEQILDMSYLMSYTILYQNSLNTPSHLQLVGRRC